MSQILGNAAMAAALVVAMAAFTPCVVAQEVDSKADRENFAAQAIGVNLAFFEACSLLTAPSLYLSAFQLNSNRFRAYETLTCIVLCDVNKIPNTSVQAQRAGLEPTDANIFPNIWDSAGGWKTPAFTSMCSSVTDELDPTDAASSNLPLYGGYFEAGSVHQSNRFVLTVFFVTVLPEERFHVMCCCPCARPPLSRCSGHALCSIDAWSGP